MARVFKSACASLDGRKYEPTRLRRSRALPTYITRLNRSRIRYTPGLCGTSCTFLCKSGFSFVDAAIRLQIYARSRDLKIAIASPGRCKLNVPTETRPRKFPRALLIFPERPFRLGSCRCRSSCFLVLNYRGRSAQYHLAHKYPVANRGVVNSRRHIWSNGRPT